MTSGRVIHGRRERGFLKNPAERAPPVGNSVLYSTVNISGTRSYRAEHPEDCYSYSQFCRRHRRWRERKRLSMRQEHKAGEKAYVDYAGMKVPIYKRGTDEVQSYASIFVGALGASSYTYAEACRGEDTVSWLGAHCRMFIFFGGVPELLVPDNLKAGVSKACYAENMVDVIVFMASHVSNTDQWSAPIISASNVFERWFKYKPTILPTNKPAMAPGTPPTRK